MPRFPQTDYFQHTRKRPDRSGITDAWIEHVINNPEHEEIQADGRIRRWVRISGFQNRALRVILLKDKKTVHNAFFDRDYEEKIK
ncbi:hypothetical protein QPK87_23740 [Kamptonema cortianum]|nr:hypothetical protein [Oscillatoria laete-virens]MDK3159563.1 hypothetical protein [Kamptonema cortianum]MDL5053299.1 hypothetical protein [Oscillatoria laete-virens NRMC-F 0139]